MEQNDPEAIAIWEWFRQISMVEFERVYQLLGITFDSYVGESFYRDKARRCCIARSSIILQSVSM